jgi:hypothetical protein
VSVYTAEQEDLIQQYVREQEQQERQTWKPQPDLSDVTDEVLWAEIGRRRVAQRKLWTSTCGCGKCGKCKQREYRRERRRAGLA